MMEGQIDQRMILWVDGGLGVPILSMWGRFGRGVLGIAVIAL